LRSVFWYHPFVWIEKLNIWSLWSIDALSKESASAKSVRAHVKIHGLLLIKPATRNHKYVKWDRGDSFHVYSTFQIHLREWRRVNDTFGISGEAIKDFLHAHIYRWEKWFLKPPECFWTMRDGTYKRTKLKPGIMFIRFTHQGSPAKKISPRRNLTLIRNPSNIDKTYQWTILLFLIS